MDTCQDEIQIKWTPKMELFVVRQFAEFFKAAEIAENITKAYYDEYKAELLNYGKKKVCKFLLRRIHKLSPNHSQFPRQYQDLDDKWRVEYLEDLKSTFLYHPRNRLRALDELYEKVDESLMAAAKPNEIQHCMRACLKILKEAAVESENIEANVEVSTATNGKAKTPLRTYIQSLPEEKVIELKGKIKRGESIEFPDWVETGYSLN